MVWMLSTRLYDHAPEGVRQTLVVSALAWFVIDSLGSITAGQWPNACWNVLVLLLVVGPLWRPATP